MSNYLDYLKSIQGKNTLKRKLEYIRYNFNRFISPKSSILEIGPGLGEFVHYLNSININSIDIIDNEKTIINYIKRNFKIRNSYFSNNLPTVIINTKTTYDIIFALQVFEHLPKKLIVQALSAMYHQLKTNGRIIIVVPNGANPFNLIERYSDFTHKRLFTDNSLFQMSALAGIPQNKVKVTNYNIPRTNIINIIRSLLQSCFFFHLRILQIINGGVISRHLTPNICLIINK